MEKKLSLRIPEELHADLVRAAEQDLRSLHSEIIYLLRLHMQERAGGARVPTNGREDDDGDGR